MVLSDTVQFVIIFVLPIVFSAWALMDTEYRMLLKVISAIFWFIDGLTVFYFFGASSLLAIPLMMMFMGLGLVFTFSIVTDFKQKERDRVYGWMDQD